MGPWLINLVSMTFSYIIKSFNTVYESKILVLMNFDAFLLNNSTEMRQKLSKIIDFNEIPNNFVSEFIEQFIF